MTATPPPGAWSDPGFAEVASVVGRHAGLKVPPHRYPDLEVAARREMAHAGLRDPSEYARRLAEGELPLADLLAAFTVAETYFFRDLPQFELLRDRILPELLAARAPDHVFRAWSAGCATGEEAYSVALTLDAAGLGERWRVLATDISRPSLSRARAGAYGAWSLRGPGKSLAERSLRRVGEGRFEVDPRVRERVRFEYLNLAEDVYPALASGTCGLDVVLCRNVFIYFERDVIAQVARRLHAALANGGWLLPGLADPPLTPFAPFEAITTDAGVLYRKIAAVEAEGRGVRGGRARRRARGEERSSSPPMATPAAASARGSDRERRREPSEPVPTPPPFPARAEEPDVPARMGGAPARPPAEARPPEAAAGADAAARFQAGDWDALLSRREALLANPVDAAILVRAAANAGDLGAAEAVAAEAAARHPLSAELHLLRAMLLLDLGRDGESRAAVERALYLDRRLVIAHVAYATLLARQGDVAGACRAWRTVRRLCAAVPPDVVLPLSDGQCAGRVSEIASAQLSFLGGGDEP